MNNRTILSLLRRGNSIDTVSSDCWTWISTKDAKGYGQIMSGGKSWKAHRWFYIIQKGDIPVGLELDHLCRNRACVNPNHLEAVTHLENVGRGLNAKKEYCKYGHKKGTRISNGKPRLECFECRRQRDKASYEARKATV